MGGEVDFLEPATGAHDGGWRIIAVNTAGSAHLRSGLPCDDALKVVMKGEIVVAVVSDGAGSAKRAREGAAILVDAVTQTITEALEGERAKISADTDALAQWRGIFESGITLARAKAAEFVCGCGEQPEDQVPRLGDFHATLVGMVLSDKAGIFFHIGDGLAATFDVERKGEESKMLSRAISLPDVGEYVGQTYFFTMDLWREYLRLTAFVPQDNIFIMTDGVSAFALADDGQLNHAFLGPIETYLAGVLPQEGAEALLGTLTCDQAEAVCNDDKTIVWITRAVELDGRVPPTDGCAGTAVPNTLATL